jgi:hypothetical protein
MINLLKEICLVLALRMSMMNIAALFAEGLSEASAPAEGEALADGDALGDAETLGEGESLGEGDILAEGVELPGEHV